MRRLFTLSAMVVVLALGCGGNGGSDNPADDVGPVTDVVAEDAALDGAGGEIVPDGTGETAEEVLLPESPVSEDFAGDICKTWCDHASHCTGEPDADDCLEACLAAVAADPEFALKLVCAHSSGGDTPDEYCEAFDACNGQWETSEDCGQWCVLMEGCNALGNAQMGYDAEDCGLTCTAFFEFGDGTDEAMACFGAALAECNGPEFFLCIGDEELPDPCGETCTEEFLAGCGLGEVWETTENCQAECADFSAGQTLGVSSCLSMTEDWPLECSEVVQNCFALSDELPAGASEYCQQMNEKCGNQFEPDMGDLTDQICGWQMAGVVAGLPDLFRPLDDEATKECLDGLDMCPPGDGGFLFCAVAVSEDGEVACDTIEDVCTPADFASEMALTCKMTSAFMDAVFPEAAEQFISCIADAADCESKLECLPDDEEGAGGGSGGGGGGQ